MTIELHGTVFSALDLTSAYHHLRLYPSTNHATTFMFHDQYYKWNVLPFGSTNAPEVFSRYLSGLLAHKRSSVRIYLDDIPIVSPNVKAHKQDLKEVFELLSSQNLHLNPDKSKFFFQDDAT